MIEIESKFAIGAEIVIKDLYPHRSRGVWKVHDVRAENYILLTGTGEDVISCNREWVDKHMCLKKVADILSIEI
jgi:hypothetical protein